MNALTRSQLAASLARFAAMDEYAEQRRVEHCVSEAADMIRRGAKLLDYACRCPAVEPQVNAIDGIDQLEIIAAKLVAIVDGEN